MSRRPWLLPMALALASVAVRASEVLVVDTDASVANYQVVEKTFAAELGRPARLVDMARDAPDKAAMKKVIAQTDPPLLYCIGSRAYLETHELAGDRWVVLSSAINWQRLPRGPKTYGIASELSAPMQLTLFRYFFPQVTRVGVLYSKTYNKEWLATAEADARGLGMEVIGLPVEAPKDIAPALAKALPKLDALWLIPDPVVLAEETSVKKVFASCREKGKAVFAYNDVFAEEGAVLMISPDLPTIGRQAAGVANALLQGKPPAAPFQDPAGSSVALNPKAAKALGLKLNEDALDSVNRIID